MRSTWEKLDSALFSNRFHVILLPIPLTYFWGQALTLSLPFAYYLMITFQTAGVYWANLYTDTREDSFNFPQEGRLIRPQAPWVLPLVLSCYVISFLIAASLSWRLVLFGTVLNALAFFYGAQVSLPLMLGKASFRIKAIPWLKNAYAAVLWSLALLVAPYVYLGTFPDLRLALAVPIMMLLTFYVELMADVRDIKGDEVASVRTVPVVLGLPLTRWLLHAATALSTFLVVSGIQLALLPRVFWLFIPHAAATAVFTEVYLRRKDYRTTSHIYLFYAFCMLGLAIILSHMEDLPPFSTGEALREGPG